MAIGAASARDTETKAKIFISYSRKDLSFADRLEAALKARGFEVLIDRTEIYAFEDWWKRIEALIGSADTIVFVLSPEAVTSDVALKEVAHAALLNKRFAPIVARRVEDAAVPEALRRLNFIFFDDPDRFEAGADQLAEALATDIGWIRQHTELGEAARRWEKAGRASGLLLRSPALEAAEHWLGAHPVGAPAPSAGTHALIAASRRDTVRRRLRAQVGGALLIVVAIAVALAWRYETNLSHLAYWYEHVSGHVLTATQEAGLHAHDSFTECTDCPAMIVVQAGSFLMGSPNGVGHPEEHPQHNVTFGQPFAVAKYAVTFDQWDACVAHGPCVEADDQNWGRGSRPVIDVSWDDAQVYVKWLAAMTGKAYRLLSEAEYEYAARAGTTTNYPWGDEVGTNNANCNGCGSQWDKRETAVVGSFPANAFGLFDMNGNVGQWVQDCIVLDYNGAPTNGTDNEAGPCTARVLRGGSAFDVPDEIRSASRHGHPRAMRNFADGLRVARALTPH